MEKLNPLNKKTKIFLIIVLAMFFLISCDTTVISDTENIQVHIGHGLKRIIDKEAGVVCWVYTTYENGVSLDCLRLTETKLRTELE